MGESLDVKSQVFLREDQVVALDQAVVQRRTEARAAGSKGSHINRGTLIREAVDKLFGLNAEANQQEVAQA